MKKLLLIAAVVLFSSTVAAESRYVCQNGQQERIISVVYPQGGNLPCEVRYQKGNKVQTLWNAQNEVGYCQARAEEFVEKQKGWGWNCQQVEK